jgi:hypothetical protein
MMSVLFWAGLRVRITHMRRGMGVVARKGESE